MEADVINRDANDKLKGFVLQKWRATELLVEALHDNAYTHIYCTIEMYDDVYKRTLTAKGITQNFEQNKDYSTNFTFMSDEIRKALVNFFDIWCQCDYSESIHFAFYTDVEYTKERKSETTEALCIDLPEKPILELIIQKQYDVILDIVLKVFKEYYMKTYAKQKGKGFTKALKTLTTDKWKKFFDTIDWKFGQADEEELRERILDKIRKLKHINYTRCKMPVRVEEFIFSRVNDFFDERLTQEDNMKRLVHISEVESIIYRLISGMDRPTDPIFKAWDKEKIPLDKRDLKEKILAVSKEFSKRKLALLTIDVASGEIELRNHPNQREVRAYEFRIYEASKKCLIQYIIDINEEDFEFTEPVVEKLFDLMFTAAKSLLDDKSKSYDYPFLDDDMIKKTIYILFQSCYLSFEIG